VRTTNGGWIWTTQFSGTNLFLYGIYFTNDINGWAVGYNGVILNTSNGGVSSVEQERLYRSEFLLKQNYPNPFNPRTVIYYSVPKQINIRIIIYDALGREVTTLVNEEKPIGNYEVEFDGNELPSGIYFYQLQAGSFTETKKMVLMK
jgi:hypothetical protein